MNLNLGCLAHFGDFHCLDFDVYFFFSVFANSSALCNLWVSGLATSVRALDLQTLFSRYGQVQSDSIKQKRAMVVYEQCSSYSGIIK